MSDEHGRGLTDLRCRQFMQPIIVCIMALHCATLPCELEEAAERG